MPSPLDQPCQGPHARHPAQEASPRQPLTPRQRDVLDLLMRGGASNKVIARALGIQEGTVKIHVAAILRALRCRNRTEAVIKGHCFAPAALTN